MSERISTVVPDGTRERLKAEAKKQNRSQSNLQMKYILDGLNGSQIVANIKPEDLKFQLDRNRKGGL